MRLISNPARSRNSIAAVAAALLVLSCGRQAAPVTGYQPSIVPGVTRAEVLRTLGKPTESSPFAAGNLRADVMTYSFGQVLLQNDRVVAVTIASDPAFVGPNGVTLGMPEDQLKKHLHAGRRHRTGHLDAYDLVVGALDTRTRDLYDETDHVIYEMAAANPNDPLAPFNIISVTLADTKGMALMSGITQLKMSGGYPDQHIDNFVSDPWNT